MTIYEKQNEPGMLGFLKIQRILYSKAKLIQHLYTLFSILVSVTFIVLTANIKNQTLWNFSIFSAFIVFFLGVIVNIYVEKLKKLAAGIQQRFDIYVLGMPISYVGLSIPSVGIVAKLGKKYKNRKITGLENWYSDYSKLDQQKQVVYCQKENINWDKPLRIKLLWSVAISILIVGVAIISTGIILNDIHLMFSIFSWLIPCFGWGVATIKNLHNDIQNLIILGNALNDIESIEDKLLEEKYQKYSD